MCSAAGNCKRARLLNITIIDNVTAGQILRQVRSVVKLKTVMCMILTHILEYAKLGVLNICDGSATIWR